MQTVKILILGPFSSGKTQFIGAVSEIDVVSTDPPSSVKTYNNYNRAFDFGRLTIDDDLIVYFFGHTIAQSTFDVLEKILETMSPALVFFMIASDRHHDEVQAELQRVLALCKVIVVANRQDTALALGLGQIRRTLQIPDDISVLPCIAKDDAYVRRVLMEGLASLPATETLTKVINKLATPMAQALDLSIYEEKPEIAWGTMAVFRAGDTHFTQASPEIQKDFIAGGYYQGKLPEFRKPPNYEYVEARLQIGQQVILYLFGGMLEATESILKRYSKYNWFSPPHRNMKPLGIIFLVDSSKPIYFDQTRHVIEVIRREIEVPVVIMLDKQSQSDLTQEQLTAFFNTTPQVPIVFCEEANGAAFKQVLGALKGMSESNPAVEKLLAYC